MQARSFAEMLEAAIRRYQNRAVETTQVIEELIKLAEEIRQAKARGAKLGLSDAELAFYDALGVNDSAVKVLGDEELKKIAQELAVTLRRSVTIDWTLRENVRAQMRVLVKRILRQVQVSAGQAGEGDADGAGAGGGAATALPLRWTRAVASARPRPRYARRLPADFSRQAASADGVPCEWLIPQGSPPNQALVYLHGGGFVYGVTPQHITMVAHLARTMGSRALIVDYRLAPEHPFPAALDDCVAAYRWLLRQGFATGHRAGGRLRRRQPGAHDHDAAAATDNAAVAAGRLPFARGGPVRAPQFGLLVTLLPLRAVLILQRALRLASPDARTPLDSRPCMATGAVCRRC